MKHSYIILLSVFYIVTFAGSPKAATLSVVSDAGMPGDTGILIPIALSSSAGEDVSGFGFDLTFDTSRLSFEEVSLGSEATEAGKFLSSSQPGPGAVRVMVIGLNQTVIDDGAVLNVTFDILSGAPLGAAALTINDPSIADPEGNLLQASTVDGEIAVGVPPSPTTSSTTTSTVPPASQLWPLFYNEMWSEKKDQNLFLLRNFRDEFLVNTEAGRGYIFLLYDNSLEIALLLLQNPEMTKRASEIANEILPAVESLLNRDKMSINEHIIDELESLLNQFETKASLKLKGAIRRVKEDLREEETFKKLGITVVE